MEVKFKLEQAEKIKARLGLEMNGKVQKTLDFSIVHYLRLYEPYNIQMIDNTKVIKPGSVEIQVPFAHYLNEGIKYIDPKYGKGAFYSDSFGFWSRPGIGKISSGENLQYHTGANRGAHFVERTLNEKIDDIIEETRKAVNKK